MPTPPTPSTPLPLQGLRVVAVDDNDINLEILDALLKRQGVEVRIARDGIEALDRCADGWAELVLMDVQMPRMDGLAAASALRRDERFAKLPIIALTGSVSEDDQVRCLAAGMSDHLAKPIDPVELKALLLRWSSR